MKDPKGLHLGPPTLALPPAYRQAGIEGGGDVHTITD